MPNWYLGRTGLCYVGEEASYGTAPVLASTNAFRQMNCKLTFNPNSPVKSPERHQHPSTLALFRRRQAASFEVKSMWYPSGTLNTLPESNLFLKHGLGAVKNTTLSTTFSGTPTTTGGTIGSGTGLAIGDPVLINIASGDYAGNYVRWLTAAGTSPAWTPALPDAPVSGDTLKGCVSYTPATNPSKSLDIAHYPQAPASGAPTREQLGCVVDKLVFDFDSNTEGMVTFSGPAQGFAASPQAQPGAFTTVGAETAIPSGLTGHFYYDGTLYEIEKLSIEVDNAMDVQNTAYGTDKASAFFRKGKRAVSVKIDAKVSDDLSLWTPALAMDSNPLMVQLGLTAGRIWSIYCPNLVFDNVPDIGDSDETNNWSFSGQALGSAGNDEIYIAAA